VNEETKDLAVLENNKIMKKEKYFIGIDSNDVIWGIGPSRELALEEVRINLSGCAEKYLPEKDQYIILECTKEMYIDIFGSGYCHGDDEPYWKYSEKRKIAYFPRKRKRKNVFKLLKRNRKTYSGKD
jgi:hypothetical protein